MDKIEKALHEELLIKAVDAAEVVLKAQLQEQVDVVKALQAEVAAYRDGVAVAVAKSRKDALKAVGNSDEEVEDLFKAVGELSEEAFALVVKQFAVKAALVSESDLLKEVGVSGAGEQDPAVQDGTAAILKARYTK